MTIKSKIFTLLKFFIGWPFSLLALFFIGKILTDKGTQLINSLTELNYFFLMIGIGCFFFYFSIRSYLWHFLLAKQKTTIPFKNACFFWASSELKRYIPGNIWSFVGRTVRFSNAGLTKRELAKKLIIESELLILGSMLISLLAIPFLLTYNFIPNTLPLLLLIFMMSSSCILIFLMSNTIKKQITHKLFKLFHFILQEETTTKQLTLLALSTIAFLFFGLGHYFIFLSFTFLDPQLVWQITGISVLSYLIGYFSLITPAGFGVREGILIFFLTKVLPLKNAAFAALFSRVILIVAELLFISCAYLWHKIHNTYVTIAELFIKKHILLCIVTLLFFFFCLYFVPVSFLRYDNYYTGKYDLGNMSQTIWNTMHGRIFQFTNPDIATNDSRLATHADFILILFTPLYALWPDPRNLLFWQAFIVGAGTFFVYFAGKTITKNKTIAATLAFSYLINPSVQRSILYDFHAVTLATTFLLAAFYYLITKRFRLFLLFSILAGLCKEQVWLIIGLLGIFIFIKQHKRLWGSLLFIVGFSLTYFLITYAIPNTLGSTHFAISYFSEFGNEPVHILKNILLSPTQTLSTLFAPNRIEYFKQLLSPVGYLPIFAPWLFLFIIPELAINLLSNNEHLYQIYYQYTATITPFIFLSTMYGIVTVKKLFLRIPNPANINLMPLLICYLLFSSLYSAYLDGPLPGAIEPNTDMITNPLKQRNFVDQTIQTIPQNVSVGASNNIASHLSNRETIYVSPIGLEKAEYIVFLLDHMQSPEKLPTEYQLIQHYKRNPQYQILTEQGSFILFKKITK
jgi:uncharacterized membrane protein/uncharacterized membrane protein YbhN (UPF0104 family)